MAMNSSGPMQRDQPAGIALAAKSSHQNAQTPMVAFLRGVLSAAAMTVAELEVKAVTAGLLSERQTITDSKKFRTAKAALKIRSYRVGFGPGAVWFWALPAISSASAPEVLAGPASIAAASDVNADRSLPRDIQASTETLLADVEVGPDDAPTRRVPFDWVRGVGLLQLRPRPSGIPAHRWRIFVEDCRHFLGSSWAERAADLGRDASSLFGSRFQPPHEHLGQAGLLWNLFGGAIVQIYKDGSTILDPDGRRRNFHRRPDRLMTCLPWD